MSTTPTITLMTDFGLSGPYVAAMKGVILERAPKAAIIDVTHLIEPHDIFRAAIYLPMYYHYFPTGTVHVIVVDPGVGSGRAIVCVKSDRYFFLAPDNGILTGLLTRLKKVQIRSVTASDLFIKPVSRTFHGRDVFAPVAASLSRDPRIFSSLGSVVTRYKKITLPAPTRRGGKIEGTITHEDGFGNLVTNITPDDLGRTSHASLKIRAGKRFVRQWARHYSEAGTNGPIALFNSFGFLEIALQNRSASKTLALKPGMKVILSRA